MNGDCYYCDYDGHKGYHAPNCVNFIERRVRPAVASSPAPAPTLEALAQRVKIETTERERQEHFGEWATEFSGGAFLNRLRADFQNLLAFALEAEHLLHYERGKKPSPAVVAARPSTPDELGWVITRRYRATEDGGDVLRYVARLRGTMYGEQFIGADWSENHADALRFARKADAETVFKSFNIGTRPFDMKVEEHMWTDAGRSVAARLSHSTEVSEEVKRTATRTADESSTPSGESASTGAAHLTNADSRVAARLGEPAVSERPSGT